jgi:outer membrane protein assembly factor BamB
MHRTSLPIIYSILLLYAFAAAGQAPPGAALDPVKCWSLRTGDVSAEVLTAGNPHLLLGFSGARIQALSLDGKQSWSTELGGEIRSNLLPDEGAVFLVTSTAATDLSRPAEFVLRILSGETGITSRTIKLPPAERYFLSPQKDSILLVIAGGVIQSLDGKDGTVRWTRQIASGFTSEPAVAGEKITVATTSGQLFTISAANGEIETMRKFPFAITALGRTSNGGLVVGDERGTISLFPNASDKPYWKFKTGAAIAQAFEAGSAVIAVSNDNFVYFLSQRNGDVLWKRRMSGRVAGVRVYDRKYVILASAEDHSVILLDITNGKVAGQIRLDDDETVTALRATPTGVLLLTNNALYHYGLAGCGQK